MKPLKKEDINQDVFDLYDDYAHNKIDRRHFIEKLSLYAIGGITVSSLLSFITPNYMDSILVKPNDERLDSEYITYESPKGGGNIKGLLSKPDGAKGKLPGIVVVHENRGLNPYIEDVGRRAALEGFITLAPDALSPLGGYPGNDDEGRALQRKRDRNEMLEDFIAAYHYLMSHDHCNGNIGVVGFYETALKANHIEYTAHFYEDVNHGFHNNTTPRYDEKAATLAWDRTIAFFREKLK